MSNVPRCARIPQFTIKIGIVALSVWLEGTQYGVLPTLTLLRLEVPFGTDIGLCLKNPVLWAFLQEGKAAISICDDSMIRGSSESLHAVFKRRIKPESLFVEPHCQLKLFVGLCFLGLIQK